MILSVDKCKVLLQITDYAQDDLIKEQILIFQDWLCHYLNNFFHTSKFVEGQTISFSGSTISDSDSGFVSAGFTSATDIHVVGSRDNDGIYQVDSVAAGALTLTIDELVTETADQFIQVWRMSFPRGIQDAVAKAIGLDITKRDPSLKSFRLADYSETYDGNGRYPKELLTKFDPWKKMRIG